MAFKIQREELFIQNHQRLGLGNASVFTCSVYELLSEKPVTLSAELQTATRASLLSVNSTIYWIELYSAVGASDDPHIVKINMAEKPVFYYVPLSPPCRSALLTAAALGIDFELKEVNLLEGEQYDPDFLKVSEQFQMLNIIVCKSQ